jgi:hypothetical protein
MKMKAQLARNMGYRKGDVREKLIAMNIHIRK